MLSAKTFMIILATILVLYIVISVLVAHFMTTRMSPHIDTSAKLISNNYEDISFQTFDDLNLKGWWFKTGSEKLVIMVTGLIPNRVNTEYQGMWIAKDLVEADFNVIMYDSRAHGESEGSRTSYGNNESRDVLSAVEFAKTKGFKDEKIALLGDSTGAVSILMVAHQLKDIGAMIIDTPTADYRPRLVDVLWKEKLIPPFFAPGIFYFTDIVFGLKIGQVKPIERMVLVPERKFLFLHGEKDKTFPVEESKKLLQKASAESKLVVFPNGSHIETFKSDPDLYRKEVFGFLERELGK